PIFNPHSVVFEVSEAGGLATDELHFVVEAFGDAVVAAEAPYGGDLAGPGMERVAELQARRWRCPGKDFVRAVSRLGRGLCHRMAAHQRCSCAHCRKIRTPWQVSGRALRAI